MDDLETIKKRIKLYHVGDVPIHIVTKGDTWINGYVIKVFDHYFEVIDRHHGEVPVFYTDIRILEFFRGDYKTLKKRGEGDGTD